MTEEEKRMTAYHEAGHALCAMHEPECDPVHKATIIPRGRALGLVMSLPEGDRYSKSKSKLLSELTMAMGGRAAEEIIFGPDKVSNGAAGDIKMATDQARRMITEWGMSEKLGMIAYGDNSQEVFLGHSVTQNKNVSEATAREIDAEIKDVIDRAYAKARRLLTENIEELHRLARGLLEHETLSGDEIRTVLRGEPVIRKVVDEPHPRAGERQCRQRAGRPLRHLPLAGWGQRLSRGESGGRVRDRTAHGDRSRQCATPCEGTTGSGRRRDCDRCGGTRCPAVGALAVGRQLAIGQLALGEARIGQARVGRDALGSCGSRVW